MDLWLARLVLTHLHLHQHQQQHLLQLKILEHRASVFLLSTAIAFPWQAALCSPSASVWSYFLLSFTSIICRESNSFYFNPVQCLDGHIPTLMNYLCIVFSYQLSCIILLLLFDFIQFCSTYVFIWFFCSLFVTQKKIFSSNPGLCSRHFDPLYKNHHHLCKSINTIHQTARSLS